MAACFKDWTGCCFNCEASRRSKVWWFLWWLGSIYEAITWFPCKDLHISPAFCPVESLYCPVYLWALWLFRLSLATSVIWMATCMLEPWWPSKLNRRSYLCTSHTFRVTLTVACLSLGSRTHTKLWVTLCYVLQNSLDLTSSRHWHIHNIMHRYKLCMMGSDSQAKNENTRCKRESYYHCRRHCS